MEAHQEFEELLRMHPHHLEGLYLMGVTCINLEKPEAAVGYFERLLQVNEDYKPNAYLLAAISYNRLRNIQRALELLSKAISKN